MNYVVVKIINHEVAKDRIMIEDCETGEKVILEASNLTQVLKEENNYVLKINPGNMTRTPQVVEVVSVRQTTGAEIFDSNILFDYKEVFNAFKEMSYGIENKDWSESGEKKAMFYLETLKEKDVEVSEIKAKLEKLLKKKEITLIRARRKRFEEIAKKLNFKSAFSDWDVQLEQEAKKEIEFLRNKGVNVEPLEDEMTQLKARYLKQQKRSIDEKIKNCNEYFEDLILDGTWNYYIDEQIEELEEEIEELGLKETYEEKLNKFKEVKEQIKTKMFVPRFTPNQAKLIKEIRNRIKLASAESKDQFFIRMSVLRSEVSEVIMEKQDNYNEFCLELVKRTPYAISVIENPTPESCIYVFKKDISLVGALLNPTPELCMIALELNPEAINYLDL